MRTAFLGINEGQEECLMFVSCNSAYVCIKENSYEQYVA